MTTVTTEEFVTTLGANGIVGSYFMDLDQLSSGNTGDLFPLDGVGDTTATAGSSHMVNATLWSIDAVICRFNSAGVTLTLKDALGTQIGNDIDFVTPMPQPMQVELGIILDVTGGFSARATTTTGGSFTILYTILSES